MLQRKNQLLLRFLRIRAVVNGRFIFPLEGKKPLTIPLAENEPRLVITDGFHITRPLKLVYRDLNVFCFEVDCVVSNRSLVAGAGAMLLAFLAGLLTGFLLFKIISFLPVVYLLLYYYLNRRDFIRLRPVTN